MAHQIIEDLNWRYTTKGGYDKSKRIAADDLAVIKEAIRLSASSINSQPWKFIVIESDAAKQRFSDTFKEESHINKPHATRASHIILFANKIRYDENDYSKVVDIDVSSGRLPPEKAEKTIAKVGFAKQFFDENGSNKQWTKAQTYIALGNVLHTLARLKIDSTPMEGIDVSAVNQMFAQEIGEDYECSFALAMGYHSDDDFNYGLPKSRLPQSAIFKTV